jgi:hypothetical protein
MNKNISIYFNNKKNTNFPIKIYTNPIISIKYFHFHNINSINKYKNKNKNKIISLDDSNNDINKYKSLQKINSFGIKYANEDLNKEINKEEKTQKKYKSFYDDINYNDMYMDKDKENNKDKDNEKDNKNKYEEFTIKENPYFNKKKFVEKDAKEKDNIRKSVNIYIEKLKDEHMDTLEVPEILDLITKMLLSDNQDTDLWYKILNQFNELMCVHAVSKKDIINFLELLSHFKPKILEKNILPKNITQIGSEILFSKKHEEEYLRLTAPKDIFGQFALHVKKNMNLNLISKIFKISEKFSNKENTMENIDDLLGLYNTLFRNIELKIIDDIGNGRVSYNYKECVIFIKSFSIAQEGTNMFFELLMRKVVKHFNDLTLSELECVLNYLPHELYNNKEFKVDLDLDSNPDSKSKEKYVETGRTKSVSEFYENSYKKIIEGITEVSDELFLNLFQGCLKIKFVDIEVIGSFLLEFDNRISKHNDDSKYRDKDNDKDNYKEIKENKDKNKDIKKFVFDFLQILTYFIRNDIDEIFLESIDYNILWKSIYDTFLIKNLNEFKLKEISTLFWTMYHFKSITNDKIIFFEKRIKEILQGYLNDPKSNIDNMGYESHLRYYDNYDIDEYDVDAIKFFIETNNSYKGDLIKILKKTLESIRLENTHPISRKLFNF